MDNLEGGKQLMVCTCGNSKNQIYTEFEGLKMTRIFVKCPKCKKRKFSCLLGAKNYGRDNE